MKVEVAAIPAEKSGMTILGLSQPVQDGITAFSAGSGDFLLALMAAMTQQPGAGNGTMVSPPPGQAVIKGLLPETNGGAVFASPGTNGCSDPAAGEEKQVDLTAWTYIIPDLPGPLPGYATPGPPETGDGKPSVQDRPAVQQFPPAVYALPGIGTGETIPVAGETAGTVRSGAMETAAAAPGNYVQPPAAPDRKPPAELAEMPNTGRIASGAAVAKDPAGGPVSPGMADHPVIPAEAANRKAAGEQSVSLKVNSAGYTAPKEDPGFAGGQPARPVAEETVKINLPAAGGVLVRGFQQAAEIRVPVQANQPGPEGEQPLNAVKNGGGEEISKSGMPGSAKVEQPVFKPSHGENERQPQWQHGQEKPVEVGEIGAGRDGGREAAVTGSAPVSSITPKKFPEMVLPHIISSVRTTGADQARVTVIRLKLEPENMGEIRIRLSYAKGELSAHFYTSSGLVKDAVECSLPQLRETLAQHNVSLGDAAAFVGQEQQGQRWANFRGSGYHQRENPSGAVSGDLPGEILGKVHAGDNSLDLFI